MRSHTTASFTLALVALLWISACALEAEQPPETDGVTRVEVIAGDSGGANNAGADAELVTDARAAPDVDADVDGPTDAHMRPSDPDGTTSTGADPSWPLVVCGDGVWSYGETCDPTVLPDLDCADLDLGVGVARCAANCTLDLRNCRAPGAGARIECDGAVCSAMREAVVGDVDWIDPVALHDGPRRRTAQVGGYLSYWRDARPWRCSATLVDSDVILTNHHCAPNNEVAATVRFHPTYESDATVGERDRAWQCDTLLATSCAHDLSLLRCRARPEGLPGDLFGTADIALRRDSSAQGIAVSHVNCDTRAGDCPYRELLSGGVITRYGDESCIQFIDDPTCTSNCRNTAPQARHSADTLGGSSGGA